MGSQNADVTQAYQHWWPSLSSSWIITRNSGCNDGLRDSSREHISQSLCSLFDSSREHISLSQCSLFASIFVREHVISSSFSHVRVFRACALADHLRHDETVKAPICLFAAAR